MCLTQQHMEAVASPRMGGGTLDTSVIQHWLTAMLQWGCQQTANAGGCHWQRKSII
jgi:hypothetical protein